MIWDQWATELEQISLPVAVLSSMARMCAATTSSMCTNPISWFGYSPIAPKYIYTLLDIEFVYCTWLTGDKMYIFLLQINHLIDIEGILF